MNNLNDKIQEIYNSTPDYVHSVSVGNKIKNGIETDDISIVYFVYKKLPLEEIPENEKIPKTLEIDGKTYKTDVIENSGFNAMLCYASNDPKVTFLQSRQRPLSGGLEISNFFKWVEVEPNVFRPAGQGTLGLIAVDNIDNTLVGVSNNHVIIIDAFNSSERDVNSEIFNIRDSKDFVSQFGSSGFNETVSAGVLQCGNSTFNLGTDNIGRQKRYYPFSTKNPNYMDAALSVIREGFVDLNSASQAELYNTFAMPFATTAEINSLAVGGENYGAVVLSCGRTTGPKGGDCPLIVKYTSNNSLVNGYYLQGNNIGISFSDCLLFQYVDGSAGPTLGGDSGSALIANFSGTNKIIGLVFAANSTNTPNYGLASRIDRIAEFLNISAWNGTTKNFTPYPPTIGYIVRPTTDNSPYIDYQGKRYWQAGLITTSDQITELPL
jgi:hypothetical protein